MNLILVLSFKGSCMMAGYLLACLLMGKQFSHRMRYLWLKLSAIYYLLPMYWLKEAILSVLPDRWKVYDANGIVWDAKWDNVIIKDSEGVSVLSLGLQREIWAVCIWFGIGLTLLVFLLAQMYLTHRKLDLYGKTIEEGGHYDSLLQGKRDFRLKRKVKIYLTKQNYWCSGGLFCPFVVIKENADGKESIPILRHELMHIKRLDIVFRALSFLAVVIHWFNPFAHLMKRWLDQECEMSCDDRILEGCLGEERENYAVLLVKQSMERKAHLFMPLNAERNKKDLEERINNIMDENVISRGKSRVCILLMGIALAGSSFTVLAYEPVRMEEEQIPFSVQAERAGKTIDVIKQAKAQKEWGYFQQNEEDNPFLKITPTVVYDWQFVDEEENVYELIDEMQTYEDCEHEYVAGKATKHSLHSAGSCIFMVYRSWRCKKCGQMEIEELFSDTHYPVCPH